MSCLDDFCKVMDNSTTKKLSIPQLCGFEDGTVVVPVYDWATFLGQFFKKLPKITSYQHFFFSAENPGTLEYRKY